MHIAHRLGSPRDSDPDPLICEHPQEDPLEDRDPGSFCAATRDALEAADEIAECAAAVAEVGPC